MTPTYILGISAFYHDSAAALLRDGEIVFAAQEERYTRKKFDEALPVQAVRHALETAGITMDDVSAVGFYEKPYLKFFERILRTYIDVWPRGLRSYHRAMQEWVTRKLWIPQILRSELGYKGDLFWTPHHESHAASSFFLSGFPTATIVTVDGVGELASTTIGYGNGRELQLREEIHFPHSLGLLYSALTHYLGFKVNNAEYKVMGLAPYGQPRYLKELSELCEIKDDGSFALNRRYFAYEYDLKMTGTAMEQLFGQKRREPETAITRFHEDVARSLQAFTEEAMLRLVTRAKEICPADNLCLAGGVALNCVANGRILRSGLFRDVFVQPAAGDAGGALGVALAIWHRVFNGERLPRMEHAFLGNAYSEEAVAAVLNAHEMAYERLDEASLIRHTARLLAEDKVVGWFHGPMEFGPRALGNRSILADARKQENWQRVNLKIKFRESFRPFAPSVLAERAAEYFDLDRESPYMLFVADVRPDKRHQIPAVTHVDGTARIQTVRRDQNPRFYDLLRAFEAETGCAVLINTSFNVRGEPLVESPTDALNCFLRTQLDALVMGNFLVTKEALEQVHTPGPPEFRSVVGLD